MLGSGGSGDMTSLDHLYMVNLCPPGFNRRHLSEQAQRIQSKKMNGGFGKNLNCLLSTVINIIAIVDMDKTSYHPHVPCTIVTVL